MKKSQTKFMLILMALTVLALVFASGCASIRAASARNAYIHKMTRQHVYNTSCRQVWPTARQLLFAQGYSVKDTGEGTIMTLETEWKYQNRESVRYLVQGIQPAAQKCKVNFSVNSRSTSSDHINTSRDLEIEWNLLQKVDPAAAAKIRQEAEIRAQAAARG
jgi:hypothetical protein